MIKINNTIYELDLIDILKELKEQLAINNIYLFSIMKELPQDIMVSCPFHKDGQERKPSCGIRKEDGWVHCFTCGESCSLEQMIGRCFGKDDLGQYGLNWLKNHFLGDIYNQRNIYINTDRKPVKINSRTNYIDNKELEQYRFYHPYMYQRKMNNEVIEIFDVGYDSKTNCITFPVRDKDGNCLFVARRNVNIKFFNYPQGVDKPVYGLYELYQLKEFPKEIYIVESMIDCIYLWTFNKYAVALNGLGTKNQIAELNKMPCRKFILATDNDDAGQKARINLRKYIKGKIITEILLPEGRKDINDCTDNEIKNLIELF